MSNDDNDFPAESGECVGHTPGPWAIGEGGHHVYYVNPKIEAGDESIDDPSHDSIIAECSGMGAFSGIPDDVREANAALIAAAPDLLSALCDLAATLICKGYVVPPEAVAAIAKAEGREEAT